MATTNFNIRLEKDLRDRAFPVFERYGLSAAQAFKLFLNQVAETNAIPLSFDYARNEPNPETVKAIKQGRKDYHAGKLTGFSADQAVQALADDARD